MNKDIYLKFISEISKNKPNSWNNKKTICPFCHRETLVDIIDSDGPLLLLKNKYQTLEDALLLVIIETYDCDKDMSMYSKEEMLSLIKFSINHWMKLESNDDYKSVLFFKNFGPHSGGSISHSHMQLSALKNVNYRDQLDDKYFEGDIIHKTNNCTVNISKEPINCFTEFNVIIESLDHLDEFADNIQKIVKYILNDYYAPCDSYNLFFYDWKGKIICKIAPRFVTSPFLLGFSLKQVGNNSKDIINTIKSKYYLVK